MTFPNPFRLCTVCRFECNASGNATVAVYGVDGRKIKDLLNKYIQDGIHFTGWDGTDANGKEAASGVYFVVGRVNNEKIFNLKVSYVGK